VRLRDMYELAVQKGIDADPRGRAAVQRLLDKTRKKYEELKGDDKDEFDVEQLTNPYSDSRISFGDDDTEVNRVLVGVDIDVSEILLAKELERQGTKIDLILSHHPAGKARVRFEDVMKVQADIMAQLGIPINVAEGILGERIKEVGRHLMPANHFRVVDAARLLNMPLMSIHTPADNNAHQLVQKHLDAKSPETLEDIVGGPTEDIAEMVKAGVGTVVEMHLSDEKKKEAEKHHLNVIIAGHMASDSVGMNAILDEFEKRGVEILPCSGIIRVSRATVC